MSYAEENERVALLALLQTTILPSCGGDASSVILSVFANMEFLEAEKVKAQFIRRAYPATRVTQQKR